MGPRSTVVVSQSLESRGSRSILRRSILAITVATAILRLSQSTDGRGGSHNHQPHQQYHLFTSAMSVSVVPTTATNSQRRPTLRSIQSTLSKISDGTGPDDDDMSMTAKNSVMGSASIRERIIAMEERAKNGSPMTDEEVHDICNGIQNLLPQEDVMVMDGKKGVGVENPNQHETTTTTLIDFEGFKDLLKEVAHLSHKNWGVTSANSDRLRTQLSIASDDSMAASYPLSPHAQQLLERIISEGNWKGGVEYEKTRRPTGEQPWAVLVTGVNGIRKTTSMYQPWFAELLSEALIVPPSLDGTATDKTIKRPLPATPPSIESLPTGSNSFFRQLDHMICTLCNEEFCRLYVWAASQLPKLDDDDAGRERPSTPSDEVVQQYSDYKAAIFSRYRTLSELLGALLLKQAQLVNINCMMETSGRDVAMFHYVDHFFANNNSPQSDTSDPTTTATTRSYNKLALHFTINDLSCAQQSVDRRMIHEIQAGAKAIESGDVFDIVYTNQGGPYGSKVLPGVQRDSDKVWDEEVLSGVVGKDWYKATIAINAHPSEPWTAQAVKPDGTLGTAFAFSRK
jgi:hypothetical protein